MGTILHAVGGYFFLMLVVRVLTRRPGGQMTMSDFVLVFLMGGVIILSTAGEDRSLTNCSCAVITIGLLHRSVSWLKNRYPRLGAMVDGTPIVLMRHGQIDEEIMKGMQVNVHDLAAAARLKGITTLNKADYAILERNGGISMLKKEDDAS
jgi:uncharacterized membrane protein YcaP (DUF421 family)